MHLLRTIVLASEILAAAALVLPRSQQAAGNNGVQTTRGRGRGRNRNNGGAAGGAAGSATGGGATGGGEGEGEGNEIEQQGQFNTVIELGGGDIKTDTLFPPGVNGVLEVEFQNPAARQLAVVENTNPGNAPVGFDFLEPVSYQIAINGGTRGLTLQKVDYILNAGNALDISQGQVGRLCTETNTFVIGPGVGELEFEAEENELTLTVDDLNGEWAFFVPTGTGAAAGGSNSTTGGSNSTASSGATPSATAEGAAANTGAACQTLACQIFQSLGIQQ